MFTARRIGVASVLILAASAPADRPQILVGGWQLQDSAKVAEKGEAISKTGYAPSQWYKAVVPGTVLTSLVADGIYPEPLYGENNRTIPESLCRTSYWYRTTVNVPKSFKGKKVWLNFEGINYIANVWVNGKTEGSIKGAFARGRFEVTKDVVPGQTAAIAVEILPPPHPGVPHEQTVANGTGPNGGAMGEDGPTFAATIGWDWMPGIRDRDMGIWQNVTLSATGPVTIQDPFVKTKLPAKDTAELTIQANLFNASDKLQFGYLVGEVEKTDLKFRIPVDIAAHENLTVVADPQTLPNPKLWWPNTYGKPDMYGLKLRFEQNGRASDELNTKFGARKIEAFLPSGKDLTIVVNGVPIMCKGGNWGMDEAMKRSPLKRLDAQIRLHRDANCTMIRNWVGMSTQEDFYAMCDKYGILVWDDFWLANPSDGPAPRDTDLFLANAKEKILRFRNHPSIAVWCGRNEGDPPRRIEEGLSRLTSELDGTRFYQKHSSNYNGVGGGGPYALRSLNSYFSFNDAMHTEIGAPSIPTLESIQGMMPQKDWWPILNDDWAYHDLVRGAQGGDRFPDTVAQMYGPFTGLPDFVRKSQLVNYEAYRAIFEGRNSKLFSPATGVLLWMSNPAQPSFVWQLYSYDLEPTSALYGTRTACEPIHIQMDPRDGKIQVINTTPAILKGLTARAEVYDLDGSKRGLQMKGVEAAPLAATEALKLSIPPGATDVYFVSLELAQGKNVLSRNFYWKAKAGAASDYLPNDFAAMQSMPVVPLDVLTTTRSGQITVKLSNPGKSIALMAHLQLRKASGARVLPAFYDANYVSLLPGESRTITISSAKEDLGGEAPLVALDGWNVSLGSVKGPVAVVLNKAMDAGVPLPRVAWLVNPPGVIRNINAGGPTTNSYVGDDSFAEGGSIRGRSGPVDASKAGDRAAPTEIYATERTGDCTYTIPVPPGGPYAVRLHFADTANEDPGRRVFSVEVNGKLMLGSIDIVLESGGKGKALVKEIHGVTPDPNGNIVITFRSGSAGQPEIRGIQVLSK